MPTSPAVTIARTIAILMYSFGLGCRTVRAPRPGPIIRSCTRDSSTSTPLLTGRDEVDHGEDHDPDDVDEVPVEAHELDRHALTLRDLARERHRDEGQEHQDTDRHVRTVEAGEHVEGRSEQVRRELQPLSIEGRELVDLPTDERHAEHRCS